MSLHTVHVNASYVSINRPFNVVSVPVQPLFKPHSSPVELLFNPPFA